MRGRKFSPVVGLDASRFDPASYISVRRFPARCEDYAKSRSDCTTYNLLLIEWPTEPKHLKPQEAMPHEQPRRHSVISELPPKDKRIRYCRDCLFPLRTQDPVGKEILENLKKFGLLHVNPSEGVIPVKQSKAVHGGDHHEMGSFSYEVPNPKTPTASLVTSRKSLGTENIGGDQRSVPITALAIPKSKGTSFDGNQNKRAVSCTKPWSKSSAGDEGISQQGIFTPPLLVLASRANSAPPLCATSLENGKIEAPTGTLSWREGASPPQGAPILSPADVAGSYQPGQIVWVQLHEKMSRDSILHGHEDFGLDPANPDGAYRQAYAHPALVFKQDDTDDSRFICLKITSWSEWSAIPGGKWVRGSSGAEGRRRYYVPLFNMDEVLKREDEWQSMPVLTFADGKNMPDRDGKKNLSYLNVERVFLVEKAELRDFRIGCQKHELYLTKDSMRNLEQYRNSLGRDNCIDMGTLDRQRLGHIAWLRHTNLPSPKSGIDVPPVQANRVIFPPVPLRISTIHMNAHGRQHGKVEGARKWI